MWEWLRNARLGWLDFTDAGKLAALFLASLLYLHFGNRQNGLRGRLVVYAEIMALSCIFPVTAVLLMMYQTKFYDYPWIWSMVPLTAVVAFGGTLFMTGRWKSGRGYETWCRNALVTLCCAGILVLCGDIGRAEEDAAQKSGDRERAEAILEDVREVCGGDFCLWAPREILEYARLEEDSVSLLYGRNMWDESLNAYSYDVYSKELCELYEWMDHLTDCGAEVSDPERREYVQRAFDMGADCVLLPRESDEPRIFDCRDDMEIMELNGYDLVRMR